MVEPKKLGTLRILEILRKSSDENHKLTQQEIIDRLKKDYGIVLERKAVSRSIDLLAEAGLNIVKDGCGTYIGREENTYIGSPLFFDSELRFLIESVCSSTNIGKNDSNSLAARLKMLSNEHFKKSSVYSTDNRFNTVNTVIYDNIDLINDAVEQNKKIRFCYLEYGMDKKLHNSTPGTITVSPYKIFLQEGKYYLMAYNGKHRNISYLRVDRLSKITILKETRKPLNSIPGYAKGIDCRSVTLTKQYLCDRYEVPEEVTLLADYSIIDQMVDWFGEDIYLDNPKKYEGMILAKITVSPRIMELWALQYIDYVEILSPLSLKKRIEKSVRNAYKKYVK